MAKLVSLLVMMLICLSIGHTLGGMLLLVFPIAYSGLMATASLAVQLPLPASPILASRIISSGMVKLIGQSLVAWFTRLIWTMY